MLDWIKNASVGVKVSFAPAFGVVCLALMGAIGAYANHALGGAVQEVTAGHMPQQARIAELQLHLAQLNSAVNQSLGWEGAGFKADKIEALDKRIGLELADYARKTKEMAASPALAEADRALWQQLDTEFGKYRQSSLDTLDIKSGMLANAASYITVIEGSYGRLSRLFEQIADSEAKQTAQVVARADAIRVSNNQLIIAGFVIAALLAATMAWVAARLIVAPLQEAASLAQAMSGGDFTVRPTQMTRDATGRVLAAMAEVSQRLGKVVSDIRGAADEVNTASREIANGNADLSSRTEATASALQQTAASLEQLTATVRNSAESANQANSLARQATQVADEGGQAVGAVVETMESIDAQAKKIREIIGVIDGIAFQTNILALNAAVEAARAGEQGRGFAVVAQEVRVLAQRSAEAAKEIRSLIGASVQQAERGAQLVHAAGQTMQRVVDSIRKVSLTVDEITRAANEQANGIAQVNAAVSDMDRTTQQNATMVEQAAAAAESLQSQARRLAESVGTLRTA